MPDRAIPVEGPSPDGVNRAQARLAGHVRITPLVDSPGLSRLCGAQLQLKHEYRQVTGSFKERGACNRLLCLNQEQRARGVVAASAGNHALGLSYHGQRLGIGVHVVMPRFAPLVKVTQCRTYGAAVELVGDSFDEARARAAEVAEQRSLTLVHGFDDPLVIEGQGTVGLELIEQSSDIDTVVVPVGGGGLLAGVILALADRRPDIEVIGVEAAHAPTLTHALAEGGAVAVPVIPGLADGLAVARLGDHCYRAIASRPVHVECVAEAEIASAVLRLMEVEKAVVEGAGAVGIAWALRQPERLAGRRAVVILSGGNIDLNLASRVIERGAAAVGRLCRLVVELHDHPGSLARLLSLVASTEANLIQVEHDRSFAPADVTRVSVGLVLETRDFEHIERVASSLRAESLTFRFTGGGR
jgi:threonine dehydratase